jgi:hypothetical protein
VIDLSTGRLPRQQGGGGGAALLPAANSSFSLKLKQMWICVLSTAAELRRGAIRSRIARVLQEAHQSGCVMDGSMRRLI